MSEQVEHRIGIVGAGYTAAVAAQIVDQHPAFELGVVTSRSHAGHRFDQMSASWGVPLRGVPVDLEHPSNLFEDPESWNLDAALVTYGEAEGIQAVADLRESGIRTVHLAGDLRLRDPELRREWYDGDVDDTIDALLADSAVVYGLTELHRDQVESAELVAGPGCYPTASILGLAPLAREGLIEEVSIKGYSGISGAGLAGAEKYAGSKESTIEYGQDGHRHQPEIEQELATFGYQGPVEFRPHVVKDVFQGMLVRCEVTPRDDVTLETLLELYRDAYADEPFVELANEPSGLWNIGDVRRTNLCRISVSQNGHGTILVDVLIDNLWKGASGQGIQSLNRMLGLSEETGLPASELERIAR